MKKQKVDLTVDYRAVPRSDLEAVDRLINIAPNATDIKSERDWMIVGKIFEFWSRRWPEEWQAYVESMDLIKQTRLNAQGYSKSREIRYVGALPLRLERIIKVIFPFQQFDKNFVYELTKRIKITKVGERNDAWFVI